MTSCSVEDDKEFCAIEAKKDIEEENETVITVIEEMSFGNGIEDEDVLLLRMQKLFEETSKQANSVVELMKSLLEKTMSESVAEGLSFLNIKNQLLIDYLANLLLIILRKNAGESIAGNPAIERLVEIRTILEKLRPIDQKLKYQIDKLVKTSVEGKADSDPLRFKANPDDLDSDEESDDEETPKVKDKGKSDVYRPPKIAPQHFDDEEGDQAKSAEKIKRKSINRALIRELQEEFLDTPIEVHNLGDAYSKQLSRETRDKQRYEENNFTRLPTTKQEKHKESRLSTLGVLGDEVTDFSRKRSAGTGSGSSKAKKRKQSKGGKKKFRK